MTPSTRAGAPHGPPARETAKRRQCLRCKASFDSEWAGERICPQCKRSHAWRNGAPLRSNSSRARR